MSAKAFFLSVLFWLIILFGLFFYIDKANAEITVNLVVAQGPNSLTKQEADQLFNESNIQFVSQIGEPLRIKHYRFITNPFPEEQKKLSKRLRMLRLWDGWFARRGVGADINFAITPPFEEGGLYWLAGYSEAICKKGGVAYSTAEVFNNYGAPRFEHSKVAFLHELGHLVGAPHEDSNTIMHADATARTESMTRIRYSNQTTERIKKCIKNW